jgi:protein ImuA
MNEACMRAESLAALKVKIADLEGRRLCFTGAGPRALPLGIEAVDAALGGGLMLDALHEIEPAAPVHRGAAFGFALALAATALKARPSDEVLWIETAVAAAESGALHAPGLAAFGLSPSRLLIVRVTRPVDVLWAMEEAMRCRGIAATIAEVTDAPDLTATRRLSLAARDSDGFGLLVRQGVSLQTSAAMTRWLIAAAVSRPDTLGGLGPAAFDVNLTKNRHGPCGRWTILWDQHAFREPALSFAVARPTRDRSDRALHRAG